MVTTEKAVTEPHDGMPPFDTSGPALSYFEFWPMWAFYPPVLIYVVYLALRHRSFTLPTIANPSFPGGGLVGESKSQILDLLHHHLPAWVAKSVKLHRDRTLPEWQQLEHAIQAMFERGLSLPVVAKPDLGCRGVGVQLIKTSAQLKQYIERFPKGEDFILQEFVDQEGEAGVFYCRHPRQSTGRIISLTLKYFPYVYGDGVRTLEQLMRNDRRAGHLVRLYLERHQDRLNWVPAHGEVVRLAFAGSHSRGTIFRDGTHLVTAAMEARFEDLARNIPEFYFGRFDVRFRSFASLQNGEDFTIVEANGAGAECTHIWDHKMSLWQAWRDLMFQYRVLFEIGAANRARGFVPQALKEVYRWYQREKRLTPHYPPTH